MWQLLPDQFGGQLHVLGAVQTPPLLQPPAHTAKK